MVKRVAYLSLFVLVLSCVTYNKTKFGKVRLNINEFHINPNNNDINVYKIIDTNSIYKLVKLYELHWETNKRIKVIDLKNWAHNYYKFYKNGRFAQFLIHKDTLISKNSFNIEKAEMGYYQFKNNELIIEGFITHVNGDFFMKEKIVLKQDTLCRTSVPPKNGGFEDLYIVDKSIPNEWLKAQPNW
jgi:hypothetical protein